MASFFERKHRLAILGGGPGGYEAALAGAQLGADVTVVERAGIGGAAVLTDVVPSKSLIATAEAATAIAGSTDLGVQFFIRGENGRASKPEVTVNYRAVSERLLRLARQQSDDMTSQLKRAGVKAVQGEGRLDGPNTLIVSTGHAGTDFDEINADTIVVSVGASPRVLPTAVPDGERILNWKQVYELDTLPQRLIVVGSGVTGAEFASAFTALGSKVTLVSSRDQVLAGEDADAASVIENDIRRNGMTVLNKSRAKRVSRTDDGVVVELADGRRVEGSHCLIAVGAVPNTSGIGLEQAGVELTKSGHIAVNQVARTSVPNIYAVGDCTTFPPLASVASMQGRTAVFHALGDVVIPMEPRRISANVFTAPEIATVGWQEKDVADGRIDGVVHKLPLSANPRAKMIGIREGFVKIIAQRGSGTVIGGVIVGPRASDMIYPVAIAVERRLTVDQLSRAFAVYPSLSGSITDAVRAMHMVERGDED
jgi:dihydrolipoamide dehydrogenase